jgi:hypothetical protein
MQKRARPHAASVLKGHPDHAGNQKPVGGTAARERLPKRRPRPTGPQGEAPDAGASPSVQPEMQSDRVEMAVIEVQIDNIHLELDTQMHRTAQLETLLMGIKEELRELIDLVKWLQHEVLNKHASSERAERTVLH